MKWARICTGKRVMWLTQNECVLETLFAVFAGVCGGCFVVAEVPPSIIWERMRSASSSLVPPWWWACNVYVVGSGVVVVVVMAFVGRVGCLSLLLAKSLSIESHFEPSRAVVSQVVSLVRSLLLSLFWKASYACLYPQLHARARQ